METVYLRTSKAAIRGALENKEEYNLMNEYFRPFITEDNQLYLVDEGWVGHIQLLLSEMLGCKTWGYYIGLFHNPEAEQTAEKNDCVRKGMLFHMEKGIRSPFYGIFRSNCTFWEEICQEPAGSVERYVKENGMVTAVLKTNKNEEILHKNYTDQMQKEIGWTALSLSAWGIPVTRKRLARLMLRTLLFANKERLNALQMSAGSCAEFKPGAAAGGEKKLGVDKSTGISFWGLIAYPEEYMRYFCRIKEAMGTSLLRRVLYVPVGGMIYAWCWISVWRKGCIVHDYE